jgi:hypothetical protein
LINTLTSIQTPIYSPDGSPDGIAIAASIQTPIQIPMGLPGPRSDNTDAKSFKKAAKPAVNFKLERDAFYEVTF